MWSLFRISRSNFERQSLKSKLEDAISKYININLTIFSRATVVNMVILANLWFVGNVVVFTSAFLKVCQLSYFCLY
jgi:hypothetical protein